MQPSPGPVVKLHVKPMPEETKESELRNELQGFLGDTPASDDVTLVTLRKKG